MRKTSNIGLPLYEAGEIPAHMGDWNSTMQTIDANIGSGGGGGGLLKYGSGTFSASEPNNYGCIGSENVFDPIFIDHTTPKMFYASVDLNVIPTGVTAVVTVPFTSDETTNQDRVNEIELFDGTVHRLLINPAVGYIYVDGFSATTEIDFTWRIDYMSMQP